MSKALLVVSQHADIKALFDEMDKAMEPHKQELAFIKKQMETAKERGNKTLLAHWEKVELALDRKGLLPKEYDSKKHNLRYSHKQDCLYWEMDREGGGGMPAGLASLLANLGGNGAKIEVVKMHGPNCDGDCDEEH